MWKEANPADLIKVFEHPRPNVDPFVIPNANRDARLMFTPMPLIHQPQFKLLNGSHVVSGDRASRCLLRETEYRCCVGLHNIRLIRNPSILHVSGERVFIVTPNSSD